MTRAIDHAASSVQWRVDELKKPPTTVSHKPPRTLNNARTPIDAICALRDPATGEEDTLVLGAPCRTEYVGVPSDMWMPTNAEMIPVFGNERFLQVKTYQRAGMGIPLWPPGSGMQPERMFVRRDDTFDESHVRLVEVDAEPLPTPGHIVDAVHAGRRLVCHATLALGGLDVRLDFPVKTINVNERDGEYQIDTGPILVPFEPRGEAGLITTVQLAFAASNSFEYVELLVRVPTDATNGVLVHHYTEVVKAAWKAEYLALPWPPAQPSTKRPG